MIIKKLILHNFGVYASTNIFEFNSSKPIVLIGGMNGRGKTTFLEAVLLALYGSNSFAYRESKMKSYSKYLESFVNTSDNTFETYIELEFIMRESNNDTYNVRRAWDKKHKITKESITVCKNGEANNFLTRNWTMYVENILPSGLSNFFFFDGEKIAELATEETDVTLKESIKTLLGVNIIDTLQNDLKKVISKFNNKSNNNSIEELELLRQKKELAEEHLSNIDNSIEQLNIEIAEINRKIELENNRYSRKGGDVIVQRQDLLVKRNKLNTKLAKINDELIDFSENELPLLMVMPLLENILLQSEKEYKNNIKKSGLNVVNFLYDEYVKSNNASDSIRDFVKYINDTISNSKIENIYGLSIQDIVRVKELINTKLNNIQKAAQKSINERNKILSQIKEINNSLSIEINEQSLNKIFKRIKKLELERVSKVAELETKIKERTSANGNLIRATTEFNRFAEETLSIMEINEDNDRAMKYSYQAIMLLDEFKIRIQSKKIQDMAKVMTNCYRLLANKQNLISKIEIDSVTLDFHYFNNDNNEILKNKLSAGEKQLMVISMLWALALCSKKLLPVIIDTPLSRLDTEHRIALIKTYFPKASNQTIILSTDTEIDKNYFEMMKKDVGDTFTLVYDDKKKCSAIQKGYFIGEK